MCSEWLLPKDLKSKLKRSRLQNLSEHNCNSLGNHCQDTGVQRCCARPSGCSLMYTFMNNNPQQRHRRQCWRFCYSACVLRIEYGLKIKLLTSQGFWPSLFLQFLSLSGCEHRTLTTSGHPNLQAKWSGVSKPWNTQMIWTRAAFWKKLIWFGWCGGRTYSLIWSVEVKIYNVADTFLQHNFLVVGVHEAHELGVFQGVQQQLGDSCLVLLGCHVHDVVPAALLSRQNSGTTVWIRT